MPSFAVASGRARLAIEPLSTAGRQTVALHAGVADRRSWVPLASLLEGSLAITAYDRRGFGETPDVVEEHDHADDLRAVVDHVAADAPVWLLANSQGGRIALDFAMAHPQRVAGLVLIATALSGPCPADDTPMTEAEQQLSDAIDAADEAGDLDAVNRLEAHVWLDGPAAPEGRVDPALRDQFLSMNGRALQGDGAVGEEREPGDTASRLGELDVPALVLCGDLDVAEVVARNRWVAGRLPQGRYVELPGVAHLPQLERPELVAREIETFLSAAGATAG